MRRGGVGSRLLSAGALDKEHGDRPGTTTRSLQSDHHNMSSHLTGFDRNYYAGNCASTFTLPSAYSRAMRRASGSNLLLRSFSHGDKSPHRRRLRSVAGFSE